MAANIESKLFRAICKQEREKKNSHTKIHFSVSQSIHYYLKLMCGTQMSSTQFISMWNVQNKYKMFNLKCKMQEAATRSEE